MKLPTKTNLSTSALRTETRAAIALLTDALLRIRNAITEEQRATAAGEVRR